MKQVMMIKFDSLKWRMIDEYNPASQRHLCVPLVNA